MIYHKSIHLHVQVLTRLKPQGKMTTSIHYPAERQLEWRRISFRSFFFHQTQRLTITKQIMIYHKFIHLHVQVLTRLKPQGKMTTSIHYPAERQLEWRRISFRSFFFIRHHISQLKLQKRKKKKKPKLDSSNNYSWNVRKQGRGELDCCQFWDTPVQWSFKPNIFGEN